MARRFVPEAGDIVWLEFSPQAGHEQAGHRPALVLSPAAYNNKTGTMLCCPMTTLIKGYPFEVIIRAEGVSGAVLSDQVKNLDWRARKATPKGKASAYELDEVRAKISSLLGLSRIST
ncbi:endoribonuclease MazF [Candidatus Nitrotoga sp. 1052]|uniref:endoribonuclease MazF n=1 Tax=Candidatus Nitrotoga sp. 1052 TaxID=2886964 RepID=UPI001EF48C73|nr:endoribonuclease MazF [Candidatus Nitrotoga sp. 1052]CAH1089462.1 endoribonuclease toxin MazF [Candidatus Nitrotoga sp. 1052]